MIVRKRDVQSGQPVLSGTRMPVSSVREVYDAGGRALVQDYYPHLSDAQIETALHGRLRYWLLAFVDWIDTPVEFRLWQAIGCTLATVAVAEGILHWLI